MEAREGRIQRGQRSLCDRPMTGGGTSERQTISVSFLCPPHLVKCCFSRLVVPALATAEQAERRTIDGWHGGLSEWARLPGDGEGEANERVSGRRTSVVSFLCPPPSLPVVDCAYNLSHPLTTAKLAEQWIADHRGRGGGDEDRTTNG